MPDPKPCLIVIALLLLSGCAVKKPILALYCDQREQILDPRGVKQVDNCRDGICTGVLQTTCYDGAHMADDGTCTVKGERCLKWAAHQPITCGSTDPYGDCTPGTGPR
jgi:hypothetical protein